MVLLEKIPLNEIIKISLIQTNGEKTIQQVQKEQQCQYIINCTLYDMKNPSKVLCPCRIDGKTMATSSDGYWCYAWQSGPDFQMIHSKDMEEYRNVFSCCTMLKDGQSTELIYNSDQGDSRARTAVGIDNQNNLVLFCSDINSTYTPELLTTYMKNNAHCQSAIMLDSGGSSQAIFNNQKILTGRKVANYLCVWKKTNLEDINAKLEQLKNTKEAIRLAIIEKGQPCTVSEPFSSYADKIKAIV